MKNKWLISSIVVAVVLVIGIVILQQMNKPEKTVATFEQAVEQKKPNLLHGLIISDNKKAAVNDASLNALISFLKANNDSMQAIKEGLNKQIKDKDFTTSNQQISLVKDEKKWGFFTSYKLKVKTVKIKVTGQNEDDQINLSIQSLNKPLEKNKDALYGPVLPGTYQFVTTITNQLGTFMKKEKKEVWGSTNVSLLVDDSKLARNDKKIQKDITKALDKFNSDLPVVETSGFDTNKFTNVTEALKQASMLEKEDFDVIKKYINEMQAQYLGAVVNIDELSINYFDNQWKADIQAFVSYNNKIKYSGQKSYKDVSYKSIRQYSLKYEPDRKKWMIDKVHDTETDGTEPDDWKVKVDMKIDNPPVMKWMRTKKKEAL
ncbi:TcaA second domain-containing protein [Fictibacillus gelatini]|uniref:TcaA second domain-containing protein n=1 Tax=Fictibacillus gelatini TaxID=225985 RepID=UPI000424BD1B|nr:hypothetical protein [Fictibacillus gelatini]